jgi:hypothetical protein
MKFDNIFLKSAEKIQVSLKLDKDNGYFTWRTIYIFDHTSLTSSLSDMFQTKVVVKIKTNFMFNHFFSENLAFCEIMWKTFVERGLPQMPIWFMRIAYWIPVAANIHSRCVILITLQSQQWLHKCAPLLRHSTLLVLLLIRYSYNSVICSITRLECWFSLRLIRC